MALVKVTEQLIAWFADCMRARKATVVDAAKQANLDNSILYRLANGKSETISPRTVEALCAWAGISEEELLRISKGQPVNVARDPRTAYGDELEQLCEWLRKAPEGVRTIIRETAKLHGYGRDAPAQPKQHGRKGGVAA